MTLKGSRVLVLGMGDTGLSMTRWLAGRGAEIRVADSREAPPHAPVFAREWPDIPVSTGAFRDADFRGVDLIALSPGIDPRQEPIAAAVRRGVPVAGDIELFARELATRADASVIAITGSNGKSTVTAMAGDMCRAAARDTVVAGNFGLPVLDVLGEIEAGRTVPDTFVLELSSFQLESTASLAPAAATMLNLTADHLDRYDGLPQYAAAKARIFAGNGTQVLNRDDAWSMGMRQAGRRVETFGRSAPGADGEWGIRTEGPGRALARGATALLPLDALPVTGLHNASNALAAAALAHAVGVPDAAIVAALQNFEGLPHRVKKIHTINDIEFYDDSKGTNVGATVAALDGMSRSVALIAGGDGKGQDFTPLAPAVARRARGVVLIGRDADAIARVLAGTGVQITRAESLEQAVGAAFAACRAGDAVLLSPACASYDMFRNYVHRGEMFARAVRALEGGSA